MGKSDHDAELEQAIDGVTEEMVSEANAALADEPAEPAEPALPTTKPELVALAIDRRIPSYEAWAMTVPELTKRLEALGG